MIEFLNSLNENELKGVKATSFDTRVKLFIHGDAKEKIAKQLERAGANIVVSPRAFYVAGSKGPLLEGELEKAKNWSKEIHE
jgi:pentose-5-phosphate-3-epimerase